METRITAVEQAGEEERKNMQQELKRVKQEAVNIMKVRILRTDKMLFQQT